MILDQKKEIMNEPLEFDELTDFELESIAGGRKADRRARRRSRWNKVRRFFRPSPPPYRPGKDDGTGWQKPWIWFP